MSTQFAGLEAEALKLSPEELVLLADHMLASVGTHSDVDEAWAEKVDRRLSDFEFASFALVPAETAIQRARQALK